MKPDNIIDLSKQVDQAQSQKAVVNSSDRFTKYIIDFCDNIIDRSDGLMRSSRDDYKTKSKVFLKFIEGKTIDKYTLQDFKRYLVAKFKLSTAEKYFFVGQFIINELVNTIDEHGYFMPKIKKVKAPKAQRAKGDEKRIKSKALTIEEVQRMKNHISIIPKEVRRKKLMLMFHLFAYHGLRQNEVSTLLTKNVNLKDETFTITRKGGFDSTLYFLHTETKQAFVEWMELNPGAEYVFETRRNAAQKTVTVPFFDKEKDKEVEIIRKHISNAYVRELWTGAVKKGKQVKGIFQKCNIEGCTVHSFRHYTITFLSRKGFTASTISDIVTDQSLQVVQDYINGTGRKEEAQKVKQAQSEDVQKSPFFDNNQSTPEFIHTLKMNGLSFNQIAKKLNEKERTTEKGGKFYPATVQRIFEKK